VFSVQQAVERKKMVNQFIGGVLVESEDYGAIPGASQKKVLLKPGAEKLCSIFGLSVTYTEDKIIEDWTGAEHGGESLFYYSYRCQLSRGGRFMGEAIGSCNSWESKYRYRWVAEEAARQRADFDTLQKRGGTTNKFEPNFALDKKETTGAYGKPAEYWQMFEDAIKSGSARNVRRKMGKKEFDGWEITMDQTQYRIPNPEVADAINTCQKMAQKRSLVAAVLVVTNCSDAFTQDVEDFQDVHSEPINPTAKESRENSSATPNKAKPPETVNSTDLPSGRPIPEALVTRFEAIDMDSKHIAPAFIALEKALIDKAGANGVKAYARVIAAFRDVVPKGKESKTDIKECLLDLWEALRGVEHPLGDLVEQEKFAEEKK
jgi:hypothetical protein